MLQKAIAVLVLLMAGGRGDSMHQTGKMVMLTFIVSFKNRTFWKNKKLENFRIEVQ